MQLEPKLPLHRVVPLWSLPDKYGDTFNFAKKRGGAHFVLLVCAEGVDPAPFLDQLAPAMPELERMPARGLVVVSSEEIAGALPSPPFTALIDADGKARSRFLPDDAVAGLFVLDRYADLYRQWLVSSLADLPPAEEVSGWMQAVSMQCSI